MAQIEVNRVGRPAGWRRGTDCDGGIQLTHPLTAELCLDGEDFGAGGSSRNFFF